LKIELELRQAKGYIDKDVIVLTVEDPKSNVGSGGATINALLTVTEYISAEQGYSVSFHVIQLVRILSKFSCHTVGKKEYGYKWT
jgi:fucokinase